MQRDLIYSSHGKHIKICELYLLWSSELKHRAFWYVVNNITVEHVSPSPWRENYSRWPLLQFC